MSRKEWIVACAIAYHEVEADALLLVLGAVGDDGAYRRSNDRAEVKKQCLLRSVINCFTMKASHAISE
ncbi:MAG: hypothetical protein ABSF43_13800 [Rectinemataceae bacterium]